MAAVGIVFGIGLLAGAIRLLPWLVSETVPLRVALPFAKELAASALEVALLVGPPLGWALSAASSVEHGEARALAAIGVGPARFVASTLPLVLGLEIGSALLVGLADRGSQAPGRLARALIEEARAACDDRKSTPSAIDIPLVRASWLCTPEAPPRFVGSLPGGAPFSAASVEPSDDLDALVLGEPRVRFERGANVHVHVERATIRGLAPGRRASKLAPVARSILLAGTGAWLATLAAWVVVRLHLVGRVAVVGLSAAGPVVALATFSSLERAGVAAPAYLVVPLAATGAIFGVLAVRRCVPRRLLR